MVNYKRYMPELKWLFQVDFTFQTFSQRDLEYFWCMARRRLRCGWHAHILWFMNEEVVCMYVYTPWCGVEVVENSSGFSWCSIQLLNSAHVRCMASGLFFLLFQSDILFRPLTFYRSYVYSIHLHIA
jgi:hypothetical protein